MRASLVPIMVVATLLASCFVNEAEESAGNDASQDVGLHIRLQGNFVLNRDGSRVVTTGLLRRADGHDETHLIGVAVPSMRVILGPSIAGLRGPEIMLTPDPNVAWLVGMRGDRVEILPTFLDTMTHGPPLALPDADFNAGILSGDGKKLVLAQVWDAGAPRKMVVADVPSPPTALARDVVWTDVPVAGGLLDVRFTRDGTRMVVLSVPEDVDGERQAAAHVAIWDTARPGPPARLEEMTFEGFSLNLLGILTWAIRISPDGRFAAISGREGEAARTKVIDLEALRLHHTFPCDGPVGFTPNSREMVGYRGLASERSELVIADLEARSYVTEPYAFSYPIYWVSVDGTRVVTYPWGNKGLVITNLDTMESTEVGGAEVRLTEFVVSPDADFIYLVDEGGLYLLDIEQGEVTELEDRGRRYDNINILPDGDDLILSGEGTTRFDRWSLTSATVEASVVLPSEAR